MVKAAVTAAIAASALALSMNARADTADADRRADRLRAEVDALVGIAFDELGELTSTSPGLRGALNYQLDDRISLGLALRWFGVSAAAEGFDIGYWDLAAGGRYLQPVHGALGAFFEFELLYGTVDVDSGLNQVSESDPGVGVRGGLQYWVWPDRGQVWVQTGFSRLFSDSSAPDAEWLEVGVGFSLLL